MYNVLHIMAMKAKGRTQLVELGKFEITLGRQVVSYNLRRSSKARLIWLNIRSQTGLTVTIPHCYNSSCLPDYLKSNSHWILHNLEKFYHETPVVFQNCESNTKTVPYLGKCLEVLQKRNIQECTAVKLDNDKLIISLNPAKEKLSVGELENWLKKQAIRLINFKAAQFSKKMGLLYNRITIRDQKSRWGSCSCRKNLNFSWRLIMAPEPVLDYVIINELCHLKEMSHSKPFWSLVGKHCPRWHEYRSWLDSHGLELNMSFRTP